MVITSVLSVEQRQRDKGAICLSDARSGRRQYAAGSGSVDDKSQGSRSVIRSVDPVSEHPSMTWHHFIITDRPSNTLLLTERDVTITLLATIQPCVHNLWDGSRGGRALTSIWTHLDANYLQLCQLVSGKVYHVSVVSVTLASGCQLRPIWSNDVCCRVTFPPRIVYQVRSHLLPLKRLDSVNPQSVFNFSSNGEIEKK